MTIRPYPKPPPRPARRRLGVARPLPTTRALAHKTVRRTELDKRALKLWSILIRAVGRCSRCKRSRAAVEASGLRLEAAHFIPRGRSKNIRYHPKGGTSLCGPVGKSYPDGTPSCHHWFDREASELERAAFVIERVGKAVYNELHRVKNEDWDRDYDRILGVLHDAFKAHGLPLP